MGTVMGYRVNAGWVHIDMPDTMVYVCMNVWLCMKWLYVGVVWRSFGGR